VISLGTYRVIFFGLVFAAAIFFANACVLMVTLADRDYGHAVAQLFLTRLPADLPGEVTASIST
jgi:hypothetical protein